VGATRAFTYIAFGGQRMARYGPAGKHLAAVIYSKSWEIIGKEASKPSVYGHKFSSSGFLPISSSIADSGDLDFSQ
jgi:hypothetical protein